MPAPMSVTFFCGSMHMNIHKKKILAIYRKKKLMKRWNFVVFFMLFTQIHLIWLIETANPNTTFHKQSTCNKFKASIALFFPLTFNLLQTSVFHRAKNEKKNYNFENLIKISCEWLILTQMKRSIFFNACVYLLMF